MYSWCRLSKTPMHRNKLSMSIDWTLSVEPRSPVPTNGREYGLRPATPVAWYCRWKKGITSDLKNLLPREGKTRTFEILIGFKDLPTLWSPVDELEGRCIWRRWPSCSLVIAVVLKYSNASQFQAPVVSTRYLSVVFLPYQICSNLWRFMNFAYPKCPLCAAEGQLIHTRGYTCSRHRYDGASIFWFSTKWII